MACVKICGITNLDDARAAAEAGADLLGFVFHPPSPRYLPPAQAGEIVARLRAMPETAAVRCVGVFVDRCAEHICAVAARCGLDAVQLHGNESAQLVAALMARGLDVIKAVRVRDAASLSALAAYRASAYLLDTYVAGQPGGTGRAFDWALAARAREYGRIILAGGLTPENVAHALRAAHPWGVDVSSGVEAAPGRKDYERLRRFVAAAKGAILSADTVAGCG